MDETAKVKAAAAAAEAAALAAPQVGAALHMPVSKAASEACKSHHVAVKQIIC